MIIRNAARCRLCGDEIESRHRHDMVTCKCGSVSVDGGTAYLRRSFDSIRNFEDLSVVVPDDSGGVA